MILIRFMTETEKELYLSGAKILNANTHGGFHSRSFGACFAEVTPERDADKWLRKLYFIRPCEWVIEFDTDRFQTQLRESRAIYSADQEADWEAGRTIEVREWCTNSYSRLTHPYTRIGRCPDFMGLTMGQCIEWETSTTK